MEKELEKIKLQAMPILKKNGVTKAGIFGSYARGEQKKKSDIDFLIEIGPEASLLDIIGIKLALQRQLKKRVDLVEYEVIRPELKEQILNDEIRMF